MACKIYMNLPGGSKMPALGLGTSKVKNNKEFETALKVALEAGYRHINTAFEYENEKIIGIVLEDWFATGKLSREDIFITTKLPVAALKNEECVEEYIKLSLENFKMEYVDLYLIEFPEEFSFNDQLEHFETHNLDQVALWKKMEEQLKSDRTKSIGLSNCNQTQLEQLLNLFPNIKPANVQVELDVYLQQRELVKFCLENGITVTANSPLENAGYDKVLEGIDKPSVQSQEVLREEIIKSIADKHGKSSAQIKLRYLLQKSIVVIPTSTSETHIKENIDVFNFCLDSVDMESLDSLDVKEKVKK